jgi:hypothetical protein
MDSIGNPDHDIDYTMEPALSHAAQEQVILAVLVYATSRMNSVQTPQLPVTLQTMEDLPLSTNLKEWMVRQIYRHYLEELMAIRCHSPRCLRRKKGELSAVQTTVQALPNGKLGSL